MDEQLGAKAMYAALRIWISALNNSSVYVSRRSLQDSTVRAFSKVKEDQAVVADPRPLR
ncbi:MAG TPA: hypothetical protein VGP10_06470 [Marisediminicola sp.]|nr:hypothetical protein [Marisediminicola sp.]